MRHYRTYKPMLISIDVLRQTERWGVNPIKVNIFAYLFDYTTGGPQTE